MCLMLVLGFFSHSCRNRNTAEGRGMMEMIITIIKHKVMFRIRIKTSQILPPGYLLGLNRLLSENNIKIRFKKKQHLTKKKLDQPLLVNC